MSDLYSLDAVHQKYPKWADNGLICIRVESENNKYVVVPRHLVKSLKFKVAHEVTYRFLMIFDIDGKEDKLQNIIDKNPEIFENVRHEGRFEYAFSRALKNIMHTIEYVFEKLINLDCVGFRTSTTPSKYTNKHSAHINSCYYYFILIF